MLERNTTLKKLHLHDIFDQDSRLNGEANEVLGKILEFNSTLVTLKFHVGYFLSFSRHSNEFFNVYAKYSTMGCTPANLAKVCK